MRLLDLEENENIKKYSMSDDNFKQIAVTNKVMRRIENTQNDSVVNRFKKIRSVPVMLVFCLCFVSLTAYAANEIVAIYNKQGEVIVDTYPITQNTVAKSAKPQALEGQVVAYYADNSNFKMESGPDMVLFEYNPKKHHELNQLMEEAKKYGSPSLIAPNFLPEGYKFEYGEIIAKIPSAGDGINSEYNEILSELTLKAESTNDNQLVTKNVEWNESNGIQMFFSDSENNIGLVLMASYGEKMSLSRYEGSVAQKISIKNQEILYLTNNQKDDFNSKLAWYDESTSTAFFLGEDSNGFIEKEDLIKIVEGIIK